MRKIFCIAAKFAGGGALRKTTMEIARSDDIRRVNQRHILDALRRGGPMARKQVADATGMSASTVTAITAQLIDRGAIREVEAAGEPQDRPLARRGRPQVQLAIDPLFASVGVISLSLNRISAALIDFSGGLIREKTLNVPTRELDEAALKARMIAALADVRELSRGAAGPIRHVAIALQGVTDTAASRLLWSPITPLRNLTFHGEFAHAFGTPVDVANDCNMMAQGLRWTAGHGPQDSFAAILLAHGIGMGLVLKGELFTGTGSSGAEFGHMTLVPDGALCRCGRRGCIEAYAGDYAIWRNARGLDALTPPSDAVSGRDMGELAAAAKRADGPERRAYRIAGAAIGSGLRSLFALFDPFPVHFAGSGVLAFDLMEGPIREAIGDSSFGVPHRDLVFRCYPDEFPLVRNGCAMGALVRLDSDLPASAANETTRIRLEGAIHAN
jgi:predicted NBD/HSP70 family sugar kinase